MWLPRLQGNAVKSSVVSIVINIPECKGYHGHYGRVSHSVVVTIVTMEQCSRTQWLTVMAEQHSRAQRLHGSHSGSSSFASLTKTALPGPSLRLFTC